MSFEAIGWCSPPPSIDKNSLGERLEAESGLGFRLLDVDDLRGLPPEARASAESSPLRFAVTDRPGSNQAQYLLDFLDYAPEAEIGLPRAGVDRVRQLVAFLERLFVLAELDHLQVALLDSGSLEATRTVRLADLEACLLEDFARCAPPCCLYSLQRSSSS